MFFPRTGQFFCFSLLFRAVVKVFDDVEEIRIFIILHHFLKLPDQIKRSEKRLNETEVLIFDDIIHEPFEDKREELENIFIFLIGQGAVASCKNSDILAESVLQLVDLVIIFNF